ncbi:efflux RND transporter periplasmic adaptor subunit [Alcaligenes endophyticus]|uniref:Efflux RND transporter periplasmic adaptor subunit n=1 Tax=Alcaligenes endophyticus TaxID=1929088 RepID=A0ABT8EH91_9BURK|nr:efflux RND transporter periplasmic adaptor subunit [Alcaligenes endophyticus]MCX5589822.1 efflux RND transporter periplasmic adaptor subunit [Alcaligenes endophyticus]MDN4120515.1 efflux RND transporter periplasmic adaptor subunit [Alcaligenes endophyticus]
MPSSRYLPALLVLLSTTVLLACSKPTTDTDPRAQVNTVLTTTAQANTATQRRLLGVVHAHAESPLSFQASGKILERHIKNGDRVHKGQLLMRLDPKDLEQQQRAQEAAVQAAQAQNTQAQAERRRQEILVKEGATSRQAYDQSVQAANSAAANLRAAQAQQKIAQNMSDYALLHAHADGLISSIQADVGQVIAAGQPVAVLAQDGPREIEVSLPESLVVPIGSQALAYDTAQHGYPAILTELAQQADPQTRSYTARFTLTNKEHSPRLGSSMWLDLAMHPVQTEYRVPLTAIYDSGTGPGVWRIDAENKVRFEPVTIVRMDVEHAYLSQGPDTSASIVAVGAALLHEGQLVQPKAEQAVRP